MGVVFLGSEFDSNAWELASRIRSDFKGLRIVRIEDVNELLTIKDDDTILEISDAIEQPTLIERSELLSGAAQTAKISVLGPFLQRMDRIGRLKSVRVIGIPLQVDDSVIETVGRMLPKN